MNELINQMYQNLYENSLEFRLYVEKMKNVSTEELEAKYEQKIKAISYPVEILENLA